MLGGMAMAMAMAMAVEMAMTLTMTMSLSLRSVAAHQVSWSEPPETMAQVAMTKSTLNTC